MRCRFATVAAALALLLAGAGGALAQKGEKQKANAGKQEKSKQGKSKEPAGPPKLAAKAWILVDALDGEVLAARAAERERSIASATKLMTAYLALKRLKPTQTLKAPAYNALPAESIVGLAAGEKMTVKDLLYALLLESANDAAATIAVGVSGSEKRFVALMNNTARSLGLDHTSYANPIGLDESGNYSSAADLVALADRLLENDLFARIVDTEEAVLRSGASKRRITTRNTLLLEEPTVIGVKTGHTIEAGYVLVGAAERNGTTLISAVLGAGSEAGRDAETEELLDYGFSQYRSKLPVARGEELANPELDYRSETIALVAKREVPVSIRDGQQIRTAVSAPDEVEGPVEKGEVLGRVVVTVDGRDAGASALVAARSADEATILEKAKEKVKPIYLLPAGLLVLLVGLWLALRGRGGDDDPGDENEGAESPEPGEPPEPDRARDPKPKAAAKSPAKPEPPPPAPPPPQQPERPVQGEVETEEPKGRRLRRERKPKGPRQRTPEERRQMAEERARRRRKRGER